MQWILVQHEMDELAASAQEAGHVICTIASEFEISSLQTIDQCEQNHSGMPCRLYPIESSLFMQCIPCTPFTSQVNVPPVVLH